jgi:hypothetical protein
MLSLWLVEETGSQAESRPRLVCQARLQICILGRGAVRFDFPRKWVMEPGLPSFKFYDKAPRMTIAGWNLIQHPARRSGGS